MRALAALAPALLILLPGCSGARGGEETLQSPAALLVDAAAERGLDFRHTTGSKMPLTIVETMGSGCAFFDFDGDGWIDIFLVNAGQDFRAARQRSESRLYRNLGDGRFADVTAASGIIVESYAMGCAVGDFDGDGREDLFVSGFGRDYLFRNEGKGRFTDYTARAGITPGPDHWSTGCSFLDVNRDGALDLYVASYIVYDPELPLCPAGGVMSGCTPNQYRTQASRLYINDGKGRFRESAAALGAADVAGASLGVTTCDFDNDGWTDILVANDGTPNALLHNRKGRFVDVGSASGVAYAESGNMRAGMGTAVADYDLDGRFDLLLTNFQHEPNSLYRNKGSMAFEETTFSAGVGPVSMMRLGFGVAFADFDGDGSPDLYVGNGHVFDNVEKFDDTSSFEQLDQLLLTNAGRFVESPNLLSTSPSVSRGLAVGDFNNDGAPDVLINNLDRPVRLLENRRAPGAPWLGLMLRPARGSAIGSRVELRAHGAMQVREVASGGSYLSQHDSRPLFALKPGSTAEDVRILIRWPDGSSQDVRPEALNQYLTVSQASKP